MVANNAYITVGDPYQNPQENPFRQPKKGEKAPTPFQVKVRLHLHWLSLFKCIKMLKILNFKSYF